MRDPSTPRAWAAQLTGMLNQVLGADRFPVKVAEVARGWTPQRFPDDPIVEVQGADLPGFEGALVRVPRGWAILYNSGVTSTGRANFTLAHELGHYLLHRGANPDGVQCLTDDVAGGIEGKRAIEREADTFAADLLMPRDDFRRQIAARDTPDIDALSACADRYRVSLLAATRQWLSYTERRAIMVVSREGFILWARSSESALKTRAYFRTSSGPIEIPEASLAARQDRLVDNRAGALHAPGVWFGEETKEMAVLSDQYDFTLSLLLLGDPPERYSDFLDEEEDSVAVSVDSKFEQRYRS